MSEFAFELSLCAHLEATTDSIIARQLGGGVAAPGKRVLDTVLVEQGPSFDARTAISSETIPDAAIESDAGLGRFRDRRNVLSGPPRRAKSVVERAVEAGFFERERRDGREYVRQVARYPDNWFSRIIAVENKPDLGRPGALETQLRKDVSLGLVDEVVLATESYVTGAHLNRLPEAVGIWRFDPDAVGDDPIEVVREPTPLPTDTGGIELLERHAGRADITTVSPEEKTRARRRIAERAYGKGWRTYEFPECGNVSAAACGDCRGLPYCSWYNRLVDPASDCGPDCPGYKAADSPEVDLHAERAETSPWIADPDGRQRRQAGLDRFG
ncbi:DUF5787 family protein [Natranaeroarchaeum aerophilus]|uniref:DUF5787 family protein n=1 Tax=Natranaeroarchaeum aerophilus TaxID=2917711 RepID=A0AAE3FTP1_9EURY|nr:DUF5787 family protein [Natranaeroarchaeum aerophilus]